MSRRGIEILLIIALAAPCFAGDREFKSVVNAIETEYNTKHVRIPMLKLASFYLRTAGTPGTSGFQLAVFDHLDLSSDDASSEDFEQKVTRALGANWHPVVRVRSHGENKFTVIYASTDEKKMKMMIIALQPENATVVQVTLKESDLKKWIKDPEKAAENASDDR